MQETMVAELVAESEELVAGSGPLTQTVVDTLVRHRQRLDALEAENIDLRARVAWCEGEMAAAELLVAGAITEVAHLGQKLLGLAGPPAP